MQIRLNGLLHSEDNSAFKVIYPFSLLHLNTVQILQYDGVMMYLFDLHWLGIVVDIEVAIFFMMIGNFASKSIKICKYLDHGFSGD